MTDLLSPEGEERDAVRRYKDRARSAVGDAVKRGRLVSQPCSWQEDPDGPACGRRPVDAHHDDYDVPLGVRWLCRKHHAHAHTRSKSMTGPVQAGETISLRRFRNDPGALGEPVRVIRNRDDGERELVGQWYPAWMVEEL